jgi:hypothetical protein
MAGVFTQQNGALLANRIGRAPTERELYIAHFFGSAGAAKLISLNDNHPHANAAAVFPNAASANRSIFYDKQGGARTVAGVYADLVRRYDGARTGISSLAPRTADSSYSAPASGASVTKVSESDSGVAEIDTAGIANAFATARPALASGPAPPVFHSLFRTEDGRGAVSQVVASLWAPHSQGVTAETAGPGPMLTLFRDIE